MSDNADYKSKIANKKFHYKIYINNETDFKSKGIQVEEFNYNFYGSRFLIDIEMMSQKALITIHTNDDFNSEMLVELQNNHIQNAFRDAYRKIYLFHIIMFNSGIGIRKIIIEKHDEAGNKLQENIYDNSSANFPFVYSVYAENTFSLSESWNKNLCEEICKVTTSAQKNNYTFSSLESYLASQIKKDPIDIFQDIWISMNAYYNNIIKIYNDKIDEFENEAEEKYKSRVNKWKIPACGNDRMCLEILKYISLKKFYNPLSIIEEKNRDKKKVSELKREILNVVKYNPQKIEQMYKALRKDYVNKEALSEDSEFYQLNEKSKEIFGEPLYVVFIYDLPYELRNDYFHGNKTTPVIYTYNDYDIALLNIVNYFIGEFLKRHIPRMFAQTTSKSTRNQSIFDYYAFKKNSKKYVIENSKPNSDYDMKVFTLIYNYLNEK